MRYNPEIHKRHSIRLKKYNYAKKGLYFITICIKDRECILGNISQCFMQLNNKGKVVCEELKKCLSIFHNIKVHIYQIMPNHIHFILEIINENEVILGNIIRYIKGRTSYKGNIYWQRNYYEHIIRNEREYKAIYRYIENNPINWEEDSNYKK